MQNLTKELKQPPESYAAEVDLSQYIYTVFVAKNR